MGIQCFGFFGANGIPLIDRHQQVERDQRSSGREFAHGRIDDHARLAYVEVQPCETKTNGTGFLLRAIDWFARLGVRVEPSIGTSYAPGRRSNHGSLRSALSASLQRGPRPTRQKRAVRAKRSASWPDSRAAQLK